MKRRLRLLALCTLLLPSFMLWSCGDNGVYPASKDDKNILTPENLQQLQGVEWRLHSFELVGGKVTPVPVEQLFTAAFMQTEIRGRADLNTYSVAYEEDANGQVRFLSIKTSGLTTPPTSLDQRFFDAMRDASAYTVTDSSLHIFYEGGQKVMNFRKRPYPTLLSLNGLTNNRWRLRSFEELGMWAGDPTTVTNVPGEQIITLFMQDSMRFAGRLDCNFYTGNLMSTSPLHHFEFHPKRLIMLPESVPCGSGSVEATYKAAFSSARHYEVTDTSLHITYDNGRKVMNFIRDTASYAEGMPLELANGTSWTLSSMSREGMPMEISDKPYTLIIQADTLYGIANCKDYAFQYNLYPSNMMTVSPVVPISGPCGDQVFSVSFMQAMSSIKRYEFIDTNTLELYSIGEGNYKLVFSRQ